MSQFIKSFCIAIVLLGAISSCTPSAPYEIKSPCVSSEDINSFTVMPCVRRPVNLNYAIT
ncbi:MAG: DUF2706 domain-containing protein [Rickettsiaceae bacterium]|nr:DUF2706 domain-containing protein [Rickettsiaceae bacterium]